VNTKLLNRSTATAGHSTYEIYEERYGLEQSGVMSNLQKLLTLNLENGYQNQIQKDIQVDFERLYLEYSKSSEIDNGLTTYTSETKITTKMGTKISKGSEILVDLEKSLDSTSWGNPEISTVIKRKLLYSIITED
jgi:hypothetical protein